MHQWEIQSGYIYVMECYVLVKNKVTEDYLLSQENIYNILTTDGQCGACPLCSFSVITEHNVPMHIQGNWHRTRQGARPRHVLLPGRSQSSAGRHVLRQWSHKCTCPQRNHVNYSLEQWQLGTWAWVSLSPRTRRSSPLLFPGARAGGEAAPSLQPSTPGSARGNGLSFLSEGQGVGRAHGLAAAHTQEKQNKARSLKWTLPVILWGKWVARNTSKRREAETGPWEGRSYRTQDHFQLGLVALVETSSD